MQLQILIGTKKPSASHSKGSIQYVMHPKSDSSWSMFHLDLDALSVVDHRPYKQSL